MMVRTSLDETIGNPFTSVEASNVSIIGKSQFTFCAKREVVPISSTVIPDSVRVFISVRMTVETIAGPSQRHITGEWMFAYRIR